MFLNDVNTMQSLLFDTGSSIMPAKKKAEPNIDEYLEKYSLNLIEDNYKSSLLGDFNGQYQNIFYKGDLSLLKKPIVSVVGTRNATAKGIENAIKITKKLVEMNFVIMSGLALGIDTIAHKTALQYKGDTIAVLGTPIHKIYPKENIELAHQIEKNGLIISPSLPTESHGKWIFPRRNRLMATLSIATIIIEASETSGVLHQAAETQRQKKKLLILNSLKEDGITWVESFVNNGAILIKNFKDLYSALNVNP